MNGKAGAADQTVVKTDKGPGTGSAGGAQPADGVTMDLATGLRGKYAAEVMQYVRGCIDGSSIAGEDRILACSRFLSTGC